MDLLVETSLLVPARPPPRPSIRVTRDPAKTTKRGPGKRRNRQTSTNFAKLFPPHLVPGQRRSTGTGPVPRVRRGSRSRGQSRWVPAGFPRPRKTCLVRESRLVCGSPKTTMTPKSVLSAAPKGTMKRRNRQTSTNFAKLSLPTSSPVSVGRRKGSAAGPVPAVSLGGFRPGFRDPARRAFPGQYRVRESRLVCGSPKTTMTPKSVFFISAAS